MSDNTVTNGQLSIDGTEQSISGAPNGGSVVVLKAPKGNAQTVFWGAAGVLATNGVPLEPGETMALDFLNIGRIKVIGTNGDKLAWAVVGA